jgi:peptide methionine sulfoxide reductase msrA/msrB
MSAPTTAAPSTRTAPEQRAVVLQTRDAYQQALTEAGFGPITTEIAPLRNYNRAESYHQDYLVKNPNGYCGLGGTNVAYPGQPELAKAEALAAADLNRERQLVVFEAEDCPFCKLFRKRCWTWSSEVPVVTTFRRRRQGLEARKGALRDTDHGPVRGRSRGLALHRL